MGSETEHKIPVINLSEENLKPGTESWDLACLQVRYAMEEYGCFEIIWDKFPPQLHDSIFDAVKDLFDLPTETKMQKTTDRPTAIGYVAEHPTNPRFESIGIDNPNTPQEAQHFTNIMWPAGNDVFRETLNCFSKRLVELYETAIRMVMESYGVGRLFDSVDRGSAFHVLRLIKYRTLQPNENSIGFFTHVDNSFVSILHQRQVGGLQVKTKDGQCIDVKPSSNSFLVLAGSVLMAWSNDRIRPCEHQVHIKENKTRYSIGFFTFPKGVISVPEELVDEKHRLLYKPFDSFGFLAFHFSEEGSKSACSIKDYCGI